MNPYDIAVVLDADTIIMHQVWSTSEEAAIRTLRIFYKDDPMIGIILAAGDKPC